MPSIYQQHRPLSMALIVPRHVVIAAVLMAVFLLITTPWTACCEAAAAVESVPQTTADETVHDDNGKEEDNPVLTCKDSDNDDNADFNNHKSIQHDDEKRPSPPPSVTDILAKERYLKKFHAALVRANLVDMIRSDGPFTVVVPLDIAIQDFQWTRRVFSNNNNNNADADDEWILHLRDLLLFHIHLGGIPLVLSESESKTNQKNFDNDDNTHVYKEGPTTIVMANGQEQQIQRQTTTSHRQRSIQFTTQTQSVNQLAYQEASDGYVYMIHTVLMPPSFLHTLDTSYVVETSFFYSLLEMADLTYMLHVENENDQDVFTIMAPTNTAFAKVNHVYIDFLQSPEGEHKLRELLLYHIVPNHIYASVHLLPTSSSSLQQQQQQQPDDNTTTMTQPTKKLETMLNGRDITAIAVVNNEDDGITSTSTIHLHGDNVAKVVLADQLARNGILHMISNVLLPPYRPETTDTIIPIQRPPRTPAAAPVATPVPETVATAAPSSRVVWSLESPTMIDIVNVPLVRIQRGDGGLKIKAILP